MADQLRELVVFLGQGFDSQHKHGGSQPPVNLVPGNPMLLSALPRHCVHMKHRESKPFKGSWVRHELHRRDGTLQKKPSSAGSGES